MSRINSRHLGLTVAIDVITLLVAVAIVVFGSQEVREYTKRTRPVIALTRGDKAPRISGLDYGKAPQTLLLVLRSSCPYCRHDIPFYKKASEIARQSGQTRIVAIFSENEQEIRTFVDLLQPQISVLSGADFETFRVQVTPTLLLVDGRGRITDSWIGAVDQSTAQAILRKL